MYFVLFMLCVVFVEQIGIIQVSVAGDCYCIFCVVLENCNKVFRICFHFIHDIKFCLYKVENVILAMSINK